MEEWDSQTILISSAWLVIWMAAGIFALYSHNTLLPYIYLFLAVAIYAAHAYLACTRCFYFGKKCHILGGLVAGKLFKARKQGPVDPDDSIVSTLWLILGAFPIPFLVYYQDWLMLSIYGVLSAGWFYYRKKLICKKCKNSWCPHK